jgi:deoxyribonuclease-4
MWRARPPDPSQVKLLKNIRHRFDLNPLVIHVNYLINLASADPIIRAKSIDAFRGELERAVVIGAEYLVVHPGSHRGRAVEEGIASFAQGLCDAARGFRSRRVTVLLENTAGSGSHIGSRFEELRAIREQAARLTGLPVGYCLDTCHLLASGFDLTTARGLHAILRSADEVLGLENVPVIHTNDSKAPLGSRVDRHARIGEGHIGIEPFRRILRHPQLRQKVFILEVPIETPGDDRRNLDILKALASRTRSVRALLR